MAKLTTEEFIKRAREVHGDRYDYSKVEYVGNKVKVCILCREHGEFWQIPSNHLRGNGCPRCAKIKAANKNTIWTYDACLKESHKYSYRGEFEKGCPRAYAVARINKWLNNFEWLGTIDKPNGFWTKERVFEEARKYTTKHLFDRGCRGAYGAAERNGWFKEMTWFEQPNRNKPRVWSKDAVFELAKQFETKIAFRKANKGAYNVAWRNGWLEEMNWLDASVREPYTKEEVLSIARQYITKIDFRRAVPNVYNIAQKKGWLEDVTWFVTSPKYDKHNYSIYVYTEEENKVAYVGLTVDKKRRHYNHSTGYDKGGKVIKSPVYRYFQTLGKSVPNPIYLEEKLTANEAREKEDEWVKIYRERGYSLLNKGKTGAGIGALGSASFKWTKPKVFEEAKKYLSRSEFARKSGSAYAVACRRGWIEQMTWMKEKWSHPSPKWTKDAVFEESKKYSNRREFEIKGKAAYTKALQLGWLDNMPWLKSKRRTWSKEEVFEESKKYSSKFAFSKGAPGAYGIARREKWLGEMPWLVKRVHNVWSKEEVFEESKKYGSRTSFAKGNETAYRIALRKGWLNEFFPQKRINMNKTEIKHRDELGKASRIISELGYMPEESMCSDKPDICLPSAGNRQIGIEVVAYSTHCHEESESALYKIFDEYIKERLDKYSEKRYEIGVLFNDLSIPTNINYKKAKEQIFKEIDSLILPNKPLTERQYIADITAMENPGVEHSFITGDSFVVYDELDEQILLDCIRKKEQKLKNYKAMLENRAIREYYLVVFFPIKEHADLRGFTLPEGFKTDYDRIYLVDPFYMNRIK